VLTSILLCWFWCHSNNLTDLPDDISQLQQIRVLRLKYNQLKRVPSTITRLSQLMVLELSGNQVTRLDSNIAKVCGRTWSVLFGAFALDMQ